MPSASQVGRGGEQGGQTARARKKQGVWEGGGWEAEMERRHCLYWGSPEADPEVRPGVVVTCWEMSPAKMVGSQEREGDPGEVTVKSYRATVCTRAAPRAVPFRT